jgi:hypothetical protein
LLEKGPGVWVCVDNDRQEGRRRIWISFQSSALLVCTSELVNCKASLTVRTRLIVLCCIYGVHSHKRRRSEV